MCQHKFPPKSIETQNLDSVLRCNRLRWFGHMKWTGLYTGQILDLEVEGNRSRGRSKNEDAIKDDLRQWNLQAETYQNCSEYRKRLKIASQTHAGCVTWRQWIVSEWSVSLEKDYPVGIYIFKVNNRNTRTRCRICSKLTIKAPERRYWHKITNPWKWTSFLTLFQI